MADLMFPIIFIVVMFIIIDSLDSGLLLFAIGLWCLPVSWLFTYSVGSYDALFAVSITSIKNNIAYTVTFSAIMFLIPIYAFASIWYMRYLLKRGDIPKTMVAEAKSEENVS